MSGLSDEDFLKMLKDKDKQPMIVNLNDHSFKTYLREIQGSLFMHMSSPKDVEREVQEKKEQESFEKL